MILALEEPSIEGESSWDLLGLIGFYKWDASQREWVTFAKKFLVAEVGGFDTIAVATYCSTDLINGSATTEVVTVAFTTCAYLHTGVWYDDDVYFYEWITGQS